jgi:predicted transcriptional regulator
LVVRGADGPAAREGNLGETVPSERELEILKALWELGAASVREVHQHLFPGGELHFNTIQTMLRIMEGKGLVRHRTEGRTFIYEPAHSREQVTARFLNKVFDGAVDQLVLSLLQASDASPEELKDLEKLIARARLRKQSDREGK